MSIDIKKNRKGFSVVEVLVAIAILTISLMALMKTSVVVLHNTIRNEVRYKAIETLRNNINSLVSSVSFNNITSENSSCSLNVRNFTIDNCTIVDNVTSASGLTDTKEIVGTIKWRFMGNNFSYTIQTFVSK